MRGLLRALPLLIAAAVCASCRGGPEGPEGAGPPSVSPGPAPSLILLISLDTLRADRLGLYGYGRETAPQLSRLGAGSAVFTTAAAQAGHTLLSHKSLFTGKYPLRLVAESRPVSMEDLASLKRSRRRALAVFAGVEGTLGRALRQGGYRTVAFTDGGWMRERFGFGAGYEMFNGEGGRFREILPRVLRWLDESHDPAAPTLLFVHAYDIHCPYSSRRPYDTMFCPGHPDHMDLGGLCGKTDLDVRSMAPADRQAISDHYDGGIASADAYVGELLEELRARGLYDEAMIAVFSDHGESLGEHGYVGHGGLYLEQLMVPLIIKPPASWRMEAARIDAPVELVDLLPTILHAAGIPIPEGDALDGRSLIPLMKGKGSGRSFLTAHCSFKEGEDQATSLAKRAILAPGRWLIIDDRAAGRTEAFNLHLDPQGISTRPLLPRGEAPSLLAAMEARDRSLLALGAATGAAGAAPAAATEELPPYILEELRTLGYVE